MRLTDADALKLAIPETSVDVFENCRNGMGGGLRKINILLA